MQTLVQRGCGLDVHQATVVACLLRRPIAITEVPASSARRVWPWCPRELIQQPRSWEVTGETMDV
jgi:hypothetical protein